MVRRLFIGGSKNGQHLPVYPDSHSWRVVTLAPSTLWPPPPMASPPAVDQEEFYKLRPVTSFDGGVVHVFVLEGMDIIEANRALHVHNHGALLNAAG